MSSISRVHADEIVDRLGLGPRHQVVELASNDGYLLQHFFPKGIPVLGVEPVANVAKVAVGKGIPTLVKFFNENTGRELVGTVCEADLLIANNILPQVPDLNDFGLEAPAVTSRISP